MFLKITIVSLMTICAEGSPYLKKTNHAISSQSFHRQDVPLSYNFSSIHIYPTPYPEQHNSKPKNLLHSLNHNPEELDPVLFKTIQYAPIRVKGEEKYSKEHTKVPIPTTTDMNSQQYYTKESNWKNHLEPRNLAPNYFERENPKHKFIPGHNVEVLQSLRSPGYDTFYMSFPESLENNKSQKRNNMNNYIVYRQPAAEQQIKSTNQRPINTEVTPQEPVSIPNIIKNVNVISNTNLQEPQHSKNHRLHLNVARVYNIAQIKASDNNIKSLKRRPSQTSYI